MNAMVELSVELLAPLGAVRVRRMFGGWGLYVGDVFVALVLDDQLYLKHAISTIVPGRARRVNPGRRGGRGWMGWTARRGGRALR